MDEIRTQAQVATAVERLVDRYGWGGLCEGIMALVHEYYEGENELVAKCCLNLFKLQNLLTSRCPDAPGSHGGMEDDKR